MSGAEDIGQNALQTTCLRARVNSRKQNSGFGDFKSVPGYVCSAVSSQGENVPDEKSDFVAKLQQIEEQANALHVDLPIGLAKARLQHILVLAKALRSRLEFGLVTVVRVDLSSPPPGEQGKPA
jgi:hypothetical protein